MSGKRFLALFVALSGLAFARPLFFPASPQTPDAASAQPDDPHLFATGAACISCHSNLIAPSGEDI